MTDLMASLEEAAKKFGEPHTVAGNMAVPLYGFYIHPFQSIREELATDAYGEVYGHWYMEALDKIDLEETLNNA